MSEPFVCTTIRIRATAWEALRRLAAIKAEQRGVRRPSASREVAVLVEQELSRIEGELATGASRAS